MNSQFIVVCLHHRNEAVTKNKDMENLTLTQTIEQLSIWIEDVQHDITQDWNEEKELMMVQLQQLIIAKSNLELILKTGNQIFCSSIPIWFEPESKQRGIHRVPFFYAIKKTQTFLMGSSGFSHNNSLRAKNDCFLWKNLFFNLSMCSAPAPRGKAT